MFDILLAQMGLDKNKLEGMANEVFAMVKEGRDSQLRCERKIDLLLKEKGITYDNAE